MQRWNQSNSGKCNNYEVMNCDGDYGEDYGEPVQYPDALRRDMNGGILEIIGWELVVLIVIASKVWKTCSLELIRKYRNPLLKCLLFIHLSGGLQRLSSIIFNTCTNVSKSISCSKCISATDTHSWVLMLVCFPIFYPSKKPNTRILTIHIGHLES